MRSSKVASPLRTRSTADAVGAEIGWETVVMDASGTTAAWRRVDLPTLCMYGWRWPLASTWTALYHSVSPELWRDHDGLELTDRAASIWSRDVKYNAYIRPRVLSLTDSPRLPLGRDDRIARSSISIAHLPLYTMASSCCANLSAGPTIVRIGTPRTTPSPAAPSALAEGSAEPATDAELSVGSEEGEEGNVNVDEDGWRVQLRCTSQFAALLHVRAEIWMDVPATAAGDPCGAVDRIG